MHLVGSRNGPEPCRQVLHSANLSKGEQFGERRDKKKKLLVLKRGQKRDKTHFWKHSWPSTQVLDLMMDPTTVR